VLKERVSKILAYSEPVDMRKSFDGLIGVIGRELGEDPLSSSLFLFFNRRRNYVKGIFWDRTGYFLIAKRLERGKFSLSMEGDLEELSWKRFLLLLDGIVLGVR
jgi:transposase